MIEHGHCLPDILNYTLAQLRGFLAATIRYEAARDARLLSLIATGAHAEARDLEQSLERLNRHANYGSDR